MDNKNKKPSVNSKVNTKSKANVKETMKKIVKPIEKTTEKVTVKETSLQLNYTDVLNKIFICLVAIVVILSINLIVNIVKEGSTTYSNGTNTGTDSTEYDVSKFNTMSTTETIDEINKGGLQVVYIGRASCGYCVQFLPVLVQAQNDYGYKTTYINLEEVTTDDQAKLVAYNEYVSTNYGYTPMVLVFKDGKYVNGWVGYAEYNSFAAFIEESGIKK